MFKLDQMSVLDLFYKAYHELAQVDQLKNYGDGMYRGTQSTVDSEKEDQIMSQSDSIEKLVEMFQKNELQNTRTYQRLKGLK